MMVVSYVYDAGITFAHLCMQNHILLDDAGIMCMMLGSYVYDAGVICV